MAIVATTPKSAGIFDVEVAAGRLVPHVTGTACNADDRGFPALRLLGILAGPHGTIMRGGRASAARSDNHSRLPFAAADFWVPPPTLGVPPLTSGVPPPTLGVPPPTVMARSVPAEPLLIALIATSWK